MRFLLRQTESKVKDKDLTPIFSIAVFLGRAVDSSLALITLFIVGSYLIRKVQEAIKLNLADSITSGPNNPINQAGL